MANFLGYALRAGVSTFQSGFNMGQMKWQQNEKKKLQKKQDEILEAASVFNNMVAQRGEDGSYSDDDMMKINTSYMALGYEVKERVDGTYKAIQAMDKKTIEANYQWFDWLLDVTQDMKSGDAQEIWDTGRPIVSGEKGLQMYEALESISKKRADVASKPQPVDPLDVYKATPTANMPYGMTKQMGEQAGFNMPDVMPVEAETPTTPKATDYNTAANYLSKFVNAKPEVFEQVKAGLQKNTGLDLSGITQNSLREPETPETEEPRTTSLPQLEKYRDKALNADSWQDAEKLIKDYTEAGYDASQLGVTKEAWANVKKSDLDNLVAVLNEITAGTPEGRNIKGKKKFAFNMDDKETEKTGEEWYKQIYESYTALLKLLEEQGVDISQYKKLKPLSEIKKIKWGGLVGAGVETGDLISIYY